jgi:uncharacterized protein (DUF58 family)
MIRPESKTIFWLLTTCVCTVIVLFTNYGWLSWLFSASLALVLVFDARFAYRKIVLDVVRTHNETMPLGVQNKITLEFTNNSDRGLLFDVFDFYPGEHRQEGLPATVELAGRQQAKIQYHITPSKRGLFSFEQAQVRVYSPLKFWCRYMRVGQKSSIRVYPNYAEVVRFGLLAADQKVSQMGIHKRRQRGDGTNFQQLREYRRGDRLNRIDWRASSRMGKLISREYQVEKDQQVVLMLDCGRKMRSIDGDISHFDQSLNAMLLLSYVALRQGDSVSVVTFGGEERWLPPSKAPNTVNRILNKVYDLEAQQTPSDYLSAAQRLKVLVRKRALVIILTNVRNEDNTELKQAVQLLTKQHLVLVASLHEKCLDDVMEGDIANFSEALDYAAVAEYRLSHKKVIDDIKASSHALFLDTSPANLPAYLVNEYLSIKSRSIL